VSPPAYLAEGQRAGSIRLLLDIDRSGRKVRPCRWDKPKTVSDRSQSDRGLGASCAQNQLQRSRSGRVSQSESINHCLGLIPDKTSSAAERTSISVGGSTCNTLLGRRSGGGSGIPERHLQVAGQPHLPGDRPTGVGIPEQAATGVRSYLRLPGRHLSQGPTGQGPAGKLA